VSVYLYGEEERGREARAYFFLGCKVEKRGVKRGTARS